MNEELAHLTEQERGWHDRCEASVEDWPSDDDEFIDFTTVTLRNLSVARGKAKDAVDLRSINADLLEALEAWLNAKWSPDLIGGKECFRIPHDVLYALNKQAQDTIEKAKGLSRSTGQATNG